MIQETDEREPSLPSAPGKEIVIAWLENLFPNEMTSGKMTVSHVLEWEADKRFTFFKRHIFMEILVDGRLDDQGPIRNYWRTTTLLCAYDGAQLILLDGSDRYKNAAVILRAEAVQLDEIDPQELARFFNEIGGWYQTVLQSCARQCTSSQTPSIRVKMAPAFNFNEDMSTLPKPCVRESAQGGWTISFWALRPIHSVGCIPRNDPPELFEYTFIVSPQFEITYQERSNTLYSKYNIRDIDCLNAALKDDFYGIREEAISVCRDLGRAAAPTIEALVQCLGDMDTYDCVGYSYRKLESQLVHTICKVLQETEIGAKANQFAAAPALIRYLFENELEKTRPGVRYVVIPALMRLHPDPGTAPAIIEAIKFIRAGQFQTIRIVNSFVCEWVALIQLLGSMDPPAQSAVPFLEEMVASDPDAGARAAASKSLQSISSALG